MDPGDYEVTPVQFTEIDPGKSKKGIGAYMVLCQVTENNDPKWAGKKVQARFQYHPNPPTDGLKQMNAISLQAAVKFIEAANVQPMLGPDGMIDTVGTLRMTPQLGVRLMVTVTHRVQDGKSYQDVDGYRPLS